MTETRPMKSTTGPINTEDARAAAATLRRVVAAVDAGDVAADSTERAYLAGAADALGHLTADT